MLCYINFTHGTLWINMGREVRGMRWHEWDREGIDREGNWKRETTRHWQGEKKWEPSDISCFLLFMSYKKQWRGRRRRDCSSPAFPWVQPSTGPSASSVPTSYLSGCFIFSAGVLLHHSFLSLSLSAAFLTDLNWRVLHTCPGGRAALGGWSAGCQIKT